MRMSSHAALCSFTFSLLLTSALVPSSGNVELASAGAPAAQLAVQTALKGLRAEGFAGGSKTALPATVSSPASTPAASASVPPATLTPELMTKMLRYNALHGKDSQILPAFANALGLTASGQPWPDRLASAYRGGENINHLFAMSRGSDQDIVLYVALPDVTHGYRAQRNGLVVAAIDFDMRTHQIIQRAPSESQAGFNAEVAFWAEGIDGLLAGN